MSLAIIDRETMFLRRPAWALLAALAILATCAGVAGALSIDRPYDFFNVYSIGDIGLVADPYDSHFRGLTGAGGDVYFRDQLLHDTDSGSGVSLFVGGDAWLRDLSILNGGLETQGAASLAELYIEGSVLSGGDVTNPYLADLGRMAGGTVDGDVRAAGTADLTVEFVVLGDTVSGAGFSPMIDHAAVAHWLKEESAAIAAHADSTTYTDEYGKLIIECATGGNFLTIDSAVYFAAWGVHVIGPPHGALYINIPDERVEFDDIVWTFEGGISNRQVLVNMGNATSVKMSGWNKTNFLAPWADTDFSDGLVEGNLFVGSLRGSGAVFDERFDGTLIPEPATLVLLGAGLVFLPLARRRRRH